MTKPEWGVKRLCPTTGKRFYDLNKNPPVSPYTGEVVPLDGPKTRTMIAEKTAAKQPAAAIDEMEEDVILEEEETAEVEIEDDLLEEEEEDTVALDDIADVPGGEEEP